MNYYNEWDEYAAQWLRNLIAAGHLPPGDVDERSITDVAPSDLIGYTQCHFFAGIGGWALAARLAGWPDDRELWTGSCPCQPFSVAGKGKAQADERHLWPEQFRLIRACRPAVWMGEQVAAAVGKDWLDGVCVDMESIGYASRAAVIPACAVDAPHRRDRLWIVARAGTVDHDDDARSQGHAGHEHHAAGRPQPHRPVAATGSGGDVADNESERRRQVDPHSAGRGEGSRAREVTRPAGPSWSDCLWLTGHDGKARRVKPGLQLLAHGVSNRVGRLRAYGNAIVPQVAAEVIAAYMECAP